MSTEHAPAPARRATAPGDARITVAVITRDRAASLLRTLDALAALPERPPVVVVDNSRDDTTRRAVTGHPALTRLLRPAGNTGALGRNLAARHARTLRRLQRRRLLVGTRQPGPRRRPPRPAPAARPARRPHPGRRRGRRGPAQRRARRLPLPSEPDLPGRPVLGFLGCACVVRKEAFLGVGGYHPLLFFGGEETLLAYDLAAAGWGVAYEPTLCARHHPGDHTRAGRSALVRRNHVLTTCLRRSWPVALRAGTGLALAAATGRPGAPRALKETVVRLPAALARRRPLPPHVERAARLLDREATGHSREGTAP